MRYGYARVSTRDQNTLLQKKALLQSGCDLVIEEKASGAKTRPRLELLLKRLQAGDTLVVHKIDRLARSMLHFVAVFENLRIRKIHFQSLTENIDTTSPQGRAFVHILAAFAELERDMIRERCYAGQLAAMARGQKWGAYPFFDADDSKMIAVAWRSGWYDQKTIAMVFDKNVATVRDAIHRHEKRGRYATLKLQR